MAYQPCVMVVDDDENILSAFKRFLRKENCRTITATSAERALTKLGQQHIDLLITDVRLKLQSGITFLLQAKARYPRVPVIVITGYPDAITEDEARIYGAEYYFLKPLELDKLRDAVRKCLGLNSR